MGADRRQPLVRPGEKSIRLYRLLQQIQQYPFLSYPPFNHSFSTFHSAFLSLSLFVLVFFILIFSFSLFFILLVLLFSLSLFRVTLSVICHLFSLLLFSSSLNLHFYFTFFPSLCLFHHIFLFLLLDSFFQCFTEFGF
jgi:hypothetical protein